MSCFVSFLKCLSTQDIEKALIVFCTLKNLLFIYSSQYSVINSRIGSFSCCTCHFYMLDTDGSMTCPLTLMTLYCSKSFIISMYGSIVLSPLSIQEFCIFLLASTLHIHLQTAPCSCHFPLKRTGPSSHIPLVSN